MGVTRFVYWMFLAVEEKRTECVSAAKQKVFMVEWKKNNKLLFVYQPTTTNYRHSAAFIEIAFSYWPTATKYKRLIDNMH